MPGVLLQGWRGHQLPHPRLGTLCARGVGFGQGRGAEWAAVGVGGRVLSPAAPALPRRAPGRDPPPEEKASSRAGRAPGAAPWQRLGVGRRAGPARCGPARCGPSLESRALGYKKRPKLGPRPWSSLSPWTRAHGPRSSRQPRR